MSTEEKYFDHDADIGIIGWGNSVEECFEDAAKSLFFLMSDLSKVQPKIQVNFEFEEADIELALVTWLNLLIGKAQAEYLLFSTFNILKIKNTWKCEAGGENWNDTFERRIEVKGATLTMLSVRKINERWKATCIVDV